jgi:hypothetical protein
LFGAILDAGWYLFGAILDTGKAGAGCWYKVSPCMDLVGGAVDPVVDVAADPAPCPGLVYLDRKLAICAGMDGDGQINALWWFKLVDGYD